MEDLMLTNTCDLEPPCTHVSGDVTEHLFFFCCRHQFRVLLPMLRSLALRLSLLSAQRVRQWFTTPHVRPWQHHLCARSSSDVSRATGHIVGQKDDEPLNVSVTETELLNIARTKECRLPGVNFDRSNRRWGTSWQENRTYKLAYYAIGKLERKGMTEHAASLAALRAAIATRNEKVVANVQQKVHFDEGDLRAMAENKKCPIPGVHFDKPSNSWQARWYEQKKQKACSCPVKKFEALGMTDCEASVAALRSAIEFRAKKIGLQNQGSMKIIKVVDEGF